MSRTNKVFFAVSRGTVSQEASSSSIKRYVGVAASKILAVNPTKEELSKLYGTSVENDPVYIMPKSEKQDYNAIRITFIVKIDDPEALNADGTKIEATTRASFTLREQFRKNNEGTKIQVIDKYGRTAWATEEEFKAKAIPTFSSGRKAQIDRDYRPVYWGEEELTKFIKAYLNIPDVQRYNRTTQEWFEVSEAEKVNCEVRFDTIKSWFKGDIKELKEVIAFQPNNKVRILFGVRTAEDNKLWQDIFTREFVPATSKYYKRLENDMTQAQANGAYPNTVFEVCPLKEYVPKPTNFTSDTSTFDPFADSEPEASPFSAPSAPVDDDLPFGDSLNPWEN